MKIQCKTRFILCMVSGAFIMMGCNHNINTGGIPDYQLEEEYNVIEQDENNPFSYENYISLSREERKRLRDSIEFNAPAKEYIHIGPK